MKLLDIFPEKHLLLDLRARDKRGAVKEIVQHLVDLEVLGDEIGKKLEKAVHKREAQGSTGIGKGLAIPHAKNCKFISEVVAVFARSQEGISFNSVDGSPVHLLFLVASPVDDADTHVQIMRKIATMHRDDKTLKFLRSTDRIESILDILQEVDDGFA